MSSPFSAKHHFLPLAQMSLSVPILTFFPLPLGGSVQVQDADSPQSAPQPPQALATGRSPPSRTRGMETQEVCEWR